MAMKSIILITFLAVVFMAPQTKAQSLGIIRINGTVFCSLTGAPIVNATIPTPPFANATVQLTIGGLPFGATVTTNLQGQFTLSVVQSVVTSLTNFLSLSNVVVTTPLTACNASLSANTFLKSVQPLQVLSNITTSGVTLGVTGFTAITV